MSLSKKTIYSIVIIALMLGVGFLPAIGSITPFGMKILGIFFGLIVAWTAGIVGWPTILALVCLTTCQDVTQLQAVWGSILSNQNLWQVAWALVFCWAISKCGLMDTLGRWILNLKFIKKGPYWLLSTFWIAAFVIGALTFNAVPPTILLWSVFYSIMQDLGIQKYSKFSSAVLINICCFSYLGAVIFPFCPFPAITNGLFLNAGLDAVATNGFYVLYSFSISIAYFIISLVITKFVIKPKIDFDTANLKLSKEKVVFTTNNKIALASILFLVLFLILSSALPAELIITKWMNKINFTGAVVILVAILSFCPSDDNPDKKVIDVVDAFKNGIDWTMIFIIAMAFYMATLLTSETTGISTFLVNLTNPLLGGRSAFATIAILIITGAILTNCFNNLVCATILIPLAMVYCIANGANVAILTVAFPIVLIQGCVMPSGSVLGALMHGNKEWLKSSDIYILASIYTMTLAIVVACIGQILG